MKKIASTIVSTCFIFLGCLNGADAWAAQWPSGTHTGDYTVPNDGIGVSSSFTVTGTLTNDFSSFKVDQYDNPYWQNIGIQIESGGELKATTFKNEDGLIIINGGTLDATTINNSTQYVKGNLNGSNYGATGSYIYVNSGIVGNTSTTIVNNKGYFLVNNGNINAKEWNNTKFGIVKVNGGSLNITDFYNKNSGQIMIFAGNHNINNIYNESSFTVANTGTTITANNITNGYSSGNNANVSFTLEHTNLTVDTFNNYGKLNINSDSSGTSTVSITNFITSKDSIIQLNGNYVSNPTQLTVTNAFTNYGEFRINTGADAKFSNNFTNQLGLTYIHNLGSTLTVNGDYINNGESGEKSFHIASGETTEDSTRTTNTTATIAGNFINNSGTVEVHNYNTILTINGALGFINGTATTSGTLHTMQGALVDITTGGLHNVNGVVGVHGGTVKVANGTFTNDSKVKPAKDTAHNGVTETVHILHDGKLIAQLLEQNAGDMGVGSTGLKGSEDKSYATFGTANSKVGTDINVHDDGIFTAQNGNIQGGFNIDAGTGSGVDGKLVVKTVTALADEVVAATGSGDNLTLSTLHSKGDVDIQNGTLAISSGYNTGDTSEFTIASGAKFTKQGGATRNMVISNKIVNKGTINVTGGGLVLEGLQNAGSIAHPSDTTKQKVYNDYAGHFVTEGDVIVSGQNAYLKLDATKDGGAIDNEALNSLITNGYATSNSTHDSVTMKQASVLFYDGVGIVLANNAKLIVSNAPITPSADSVDFGDGTLFKFNGHDYSRENATITIGGDENISSAGTIKISSTSKFFATNLIANKYYTIIENVKNYDQNTLDATGWAKSIKDEGALNRMIEDVKIEYVTANTSPSGAPSGEYKSSTNDIVLAAGGIKDENFGVDEGIFESMKDLWEKGENDKESGNAGNGFVSDVASETVIPDDKEACKTLESATNAAISGGVVHLTTDASDIMSQAVNVRMDGLHADSGGYAEDISATDWGIWAIPLYQQSQVRNIDIGKTTGGYDGWLAGVVAGIDRKKDEWTLGVALGIGIGEMESTDNFADTDTDMDFWSAIAYAAYHKNRFEWKADFTYTNATSEITQANPYNLIAVAPIRADVDGQIFSIGTQISYTIIDDDVDVTPHIGLRYRAYRQGSYTTNIDGRELFDVKYADMDTLLLPAGVLLSTDFVWNDWLFTPRMDLVYTAFFGDTAINNYFGFAGSGDDVDAFGTVEMQSDILDDYMLSLSVGCGAKKDKWSFGLDFDFQRSENREAQAVFARVAYRW